MSFIESAIYAHIFLLSPAYGVIVILSRLLQLAAIRPGFPRNDICVAINAASQIQKLRKPVLFGSQRKLILTYPLVNGPI